MTVSNDVQTYRIESINERTVQELWRYNVNKFVMHAFLLLSVIVKPNKWM